MRILGTFSKGIEGSITINFSLSGGRNCDIACPHHPRSVAASATKACYALRVEGRPDRSNLKRKLQRHARFSAVTICNRALMEVIELQRKGESIPWLRVSTNGSLPQPADVRGNRLFVDALRRLISHCRQSGIPIHIPVETYAKARFYRALLGSLAIVRESAHSSERFLRAAGAVSVVAGNRDQSRIQRVESARQLAAARRLATGRKCIVCPAVANSFAARRDPGKRNARAKCGVCVACALADVDVVYPLH